MANAKGKYRGSSKKGNPKSRKHFEKDEVLNKDTTNDPSWYALSGQLLNDVATLPFSHKVGDYPDLYKFDGTQMTKYKDTRPAFILITLADLYGAPSNLADPINLAGMQNFAEIRKANSGAANYGKANLMMYYMALGSAYSLYSYLTRVYGLVRAYNPYNKTVPRYLIQAMGIDFDNVQKNIANFRAGINLFANKLNYFSTPAGMPFFKRKQMLYANIYADENSAKAQLYGFIPDFFHVYAEPGAADASKAGKLIPSKIIGTSASGKITVDDMLSFADSLILPIIQSQDFDIIAGDIRKTYSNLTVVSPITEDYLVLPVYDEMMLEQIHNMNTIGGGKMSQWTVDEYYRYNNDFGVIEEDLTETSNAGALVCHTRYKRPVPDFAYNMLLDVKSNSPTPGEVIESTRLMHFSTVEEGTAEDGKVFYQCEIATCGLEVPVTFKMYYLDTANLGPDGSGLRSRILTTNTPSYHYNAQIMAFERPPILYINDNTEDGAHGTIASIAAELNNWTVIHKETLTRMNEAAMLSLFTVNG